MTSMDCQFVFKDKKVNIAKNMKNTIVGFHAENNSADHD